jgi:DNA-directed RNA polymerase specialized sigma24 family protein
MSSSLPESDAASPAGGFAATRWSIVLAAADRVSPESEDALAILCDTYWYALYAYARRKGLSADDAAEATQEFFLRLMEKEFLDRADPQRGKFRSFLLTVFKRFLSNERQRENAQKRGGDRQRFSIDAAVGERRYAFEPADGWTPDALFERRWALTVLDRAMAELERRFREKGKEQLFNACRPSLTGAANAAACATIAAELRMSEAAVRVALHRMRSLFRELLAAEVACTIDQNQSIVEEMDYLRAAIRGETRKGV